MTTCSTECQQVPVYDIVAPQGSDYVLELLFEDDAGEPQDMTGYQFFSDVKKSHSSPDVIFSFSFTVKNQVTNKGQVTMSASAILEADDLPLLMNKYYYDIKSISPTEFITTEVSGSFTVVAQITNVEE